MKINGKLRKNQFHFGRKKLTEQRVFLNGTIQVRDPEALGYPPRSVGQTVNFLYIPDLDPKRWAYTFESSTFMIRCNIERERQLAHRQQGSSGEPFQ